MYILLHIFYHIIDTFGMGRRAVSPFRDFTRPLDGVRGFSSDSRKEFPMTGLYPIYDDARRLAIRMKRQALLNNGSCDQLRGFAQSKRWKENVSVFIV